MQSYFIGLLLLLANVPLHAQLKIDSAVQKNDARSNDSISKKIKDTTVYSFINDLKYPINDRRGDFLSQSSKNPFDIRDTSIVKRKVEYDPRSKRYFLTDLIGGKYERSPNVLSFEEFYDVL